jgi:tRNA G18 (ribose-2'-O)-methylase SpoU
MTGTFLYAPQDFRNLCALARTLEVFGHDECHVFDPHRLIRERYGKSRARVMRDVSSGAFEKITWRQVEQPETFLSSYPGRVVALVADATASALTRFRFEAADLLVFGPEGSGLPAALVATAGARVTIPALGETRSLNLSVAFGITLFEVHRQVACTSGTARR